MTPTATATRPTTRAVLVPFRSVGVKLVLRCAHCGEKEFWETNKEYQHGKLVVATIYVAEDVPLPRGNEPNLRESAPPVFEGGVWARKRIYHIACYRDGMKSRYGPAIERPAVEHKTRAQRQAAKRCPTRRGARKPEALPVGDILKRLEGRSA